MARQPVLLNNNHTYISVGAILALVALLVSVCIGYGRLLEATNAKLDKAEAAQHYVDRADFQKTLDRIDARLSRIEDKVDKLRSE